MSEFIEKVLNVRIRKKRTYGNESPKRQAEYLVKWNDIKYSDPNPKKWVLDSAYPPDQTSQKALKCFKDENPEKRLMLDQMLSSKMDQSPEKVDQKSNILGQKQQEKKRKRLLSSDEDDFALDTLVAKAKTSEKNLSRKLSSEIGKENRPEVVQKGPEEVQKGPEVVQKGPEVVQKGPEVVQKQPEVQKAVPEVVKEPEIVKIPAKIGHAIDPKINSVTQVDIGEGPKRSGICFEYLQTIGHRIIQLSEYSIDVQIKVQAKNVSDPFWISVYDFDSNFRRKHSPIMKDPLIRETQKLICLNRIVKIYIAGNTFVAEVRFQNSPNKRVFLDEENLFRDFIGSNQPRHHRVMEHQNNSNIFANYYVGNEESQKIIRYLRSKKFHPRFNAFNSERKIIFYESDKITKTYDRSEIISEESFETTISQMKSLMNRTMITSNFKIRSISEKKNVTCPEKSRNLIENGTKSNFSEMKNAVFSLKNDKFNEKDLEELRSKILSKNNRKKASEADFQKKNQEFESNKIIWKDSKQYSTLREARWARDEARKIQIKSIKDHEQEQAKMDQHHLRVSFATSQAQKSSEDTNFMFGMLELPYYPATELRKIKLKNKRNWSNATIDNGHFIFQMFNGRAQSRKKFLNAVKTKQTKLGERKEFNGDKIIENDMEID